MTLGLIDCHAHLAHFDADVPSLERDMDRDGVALLLTAGMDLQSSREAIDLASRSDRVLGSIGLHPWHVTESWDDEEHLRSFTSLATAPWCVAISEVGLDINAAVVPLSQQSEAFRWFIGLAQRESLPMVLHMQVPVEQFLEVWNSVDGPKPNAAIHGFAGSVRDAELLLEQGFWLSLGTITTGHLLGNSPVDDEVVRAVPDDRLLLDSDAYVPDELLATVTTLNDEVSDWLRAADPLEAGTLRLAAEHIARARGMSLDELSDVVRRAFEAFLASPKTGVAS